MINSNLITTAILTSSLIFSNMTFADENTQPIKHWNIGGGLYALAFEGDNYRGNKHIGNNLSGYTLSSTYAISDSFAINGKYYSVDHNIVSRFMDSAGVEITALYGTGLATKGFKAYFAGGLYRENFKALEDSSFIAQKGSVSGVQFGGGIGYNWEAVSLDYSVFMRSTADYDDYKYLGDDVSAVSGALVLAFRF